jgi:uncharacterized protein YegL
MVVMCTGGAERGIEMESPLHVLFIIDSSGSMSTKADDVRGGFNEYVARLCEDGTGSYRLSAVTFDTNVATLFSDMPLYQVPQLDEQNYRPGGNTALYDAIGISLDELTSALRTKDKPFGEDRALVIIMTDGEENSSRRFSKAQITNAITSRESAGNWSFVYLGADQDAWAAAADLGFAAGNVAAYAASGTKDVFRKLSAKSRSFYKSSAAQVSDFAQDIGNPPDDAAGGDAPKPTKI